MKVVEIDPYSLEKREVANTKSPQIEVRAKLKLYMCHVTGSEILMAKVLLNKIAKAIAGKLHVKASYMREMDAISAGANYNIKMTIETIMVDSQGLFAQINSSKEFEENLILYLRKNAAYLK